MVPESDFGHQKAGQIPWVGEKDLKMAFKSLFDKFKRRDGDEPSQPDDQAPHQSSPPQQSSTPPPPGKSSDKGTQDSLSDSQEVKFKPRVEIPGLTTRKAGERSRPVSHGVVENNPNDSVYEERNEQVVKIHAMFSDFGNQVASHILTYSFMDGGVRRLVEKLGMEPRRRDGADLAQIESWLTNNGVEEFCRICGIRTGSKDAVQRPLPPKKGKEVDLRVKPLAKKSSSTRGGSPNDTQSSRVSGDRHHVKPKQSASDTQDHHPDDLSKHPSSKVDFEGIDLRKINREKEED